MLKAMQNGKLEEAAKELKDMTPAPMNTMLEKQPRDEAIKKVNNRKKMTVVDVPPTNPGKIMCMTRYK